ncbi:aspartic peptidase domain-containing protein [Rhizoctonia solani]|nr:aspartic peptidase domain-containing protein [Rhizoctonia solani]
MIATILVLSPPWLQQLLELQFRTGCMSFHSALARVDMMINTLQPPSMESLMGSSDTFVASDKCTECDAYNKFQIQPSTNICDKEFGTTVGSGSVSGPLAFLDTNLGNLVLPKQPIGLVNYSQVNEYQNHSFSGVFGLAQINISRLWYFDQEYPVLTTAIQENKLEKPIRIPPNTNMTSLRFNGQNIPLFNLLQEGLVIGLLDTGSSDIMCRPGTADTIVAAINGTKHSNGHDIFVECDKPQIMEFQIGCRASMGAWLRTGGDCIIGLPFFRNAGLR